MVSHRHLEAPSLRNRNSWPYAIYRNDNVRDLRDGVGGATLAIIVIPREVADPHVVERNLRLMKLEEDWALRRLGIYFRSENLLSPAAALLLAHRRLCAGSAASAPQYRQVLTAGRCRRRIFNARILH